MGLDGRKLFVRSPHAALNTKLQAAAATIAKKWCVLFEQMCEEAGLVNGWNGDFAILAWIHDETQTAVRDDDAVLKKVQELCVEAALEAGRSFNFACEVNIDTKFGHRWSQTH
jgi:DNA polymerase I-like protein with 3'-5' exonuclease and polymerase domains